MTNRSESSSLGEFELIRRYFTPSHLPEQVLIGVGDDCAVLALPAGEMLVVSVDTQLPAVHFPADAHPSDIASRVLRCAASDLAAMGATPLGFTLALTLPTIDEVWLAAFSSGLLETAQKLRCPLIGGDTTRGALCISIQVHGSVPAEKILRRSGAQVGDQVWVSGSVGDGAAALAFLEKRVQFSQQAEHYLQQRFYQPAVDFDFAVQLRALASACIDVSDGLLADLAHICAASGVGARIFCEALPIASVWRDSVTQQQARQWALSGGDDYRLCFTAPPQHSAALRVLDHVFCVGEIVAEYGVVAYDAEHNLVELSANGFQHF